MAERKSVKPANPKPCAQCPWRLANHGQPHPHGFYTKRNLARLWAGLRRGERMTCHPTDPEMADFEGYEATADRGVTHECAGALILAQREVAKFSQAAHDAEDAGTNDAMRRYRDGRRGTMTRDGLAEVVWNTVVRGVPGQLDARKVNIGDQEIGYEPLGPFDPAAYPAGCGAR